MNYGLTAAAVLGVLALSAPKEPQHNLMKLPSFKGILEVRASIPGRMRLFVPSLAGGMEQALQVREQLLGTGVVHRVELEPRTGSMLVCYDERKVEAAVIEGAVIKLLGLDAAINGKQKSRMENGLHTILDAVDRGVMGATNGLMDGKMLAGTALSVLAIKEWRLAGLAVPGAMTLLWWAARLFGGDRLWISWEKRFCVTASSRVWNATCRDGCACAFTTASSCPKRRCPICIMFRTF